MAPPIVQMIRPLIAMPVALRAANTIMGLMVMQGITMSMWRGMLNQNLPSLDTRSSRPRLTFEMSNRPSVTPTTPTPTPNPPVPDDGYYQHKHQDYYDESRTWRRKHHQKKDIQVVQLIPIVQPIQIPGSALTAGMPVTATGQATTTASPKTIPIQSIQTVLPFSSQAVNQDQPQPQHQTLISNQMGQQFLPSTLFWMQPATFGQTQGHNRFQINAVSLSGANVVGSESISTTTTLSSSLGVTPAPNSPPAIMIMTAASDPMKQIHKFGPDFASLSSITDSSNRKRKVSRTRRKKKKSQRMRKEKAITLVRFVEKSLPSHSPSSSLQSVNDSSRSGLGESGSSSCTRSPDDRVAGLCNQSNRDNSSADSDDDRLDDESEGRLLNQLKVLHDDDVAAADADDHVVDDDGVSGVTQVIAVKDTAVSLSSTTPTPDSSLESAAVSSASLTTTTMSTASVTGITEPVTISSSSTAFPLVWHI